MVSMVSTLWYGLKDLKINAQKTFYTRIGTSANG